MVKKRVPDWLNSSLWSSTPSSDDDHSRRYVSKPSPTTTSADSGDYAVSEPVSVDPPVPVPPPTIVAQREPPKPEIYDSAPSEEDNGNSPAAPSAEEISRQGQLLAEVWLSFPSLLLYTSLCVRYLFSRNEIFFFW